MHSVDQHLFRRGKRGTFYVRRRVPSHLRDAYPLGRAELVRSLRTSDERLARSRMHAELARLETDFEQRGMHLRQRWSLPQRQQVKSLPPQLMDDLAATWVSSVLHADEQARLHGLDNADFEDLNQRLAEQRRDFRAMLARGQLDPILPAFRTFLHLNGIDATLDALEERRGARRYLKAVVQALELQARRQLGEEVAPESVPTPAPQGTSWDEVFSCWRDHTVDRPKPTTIAARTAWKQLEAFARERSILHPCQVTPRLMTALIDHLRPSLAPVTVNERLNKIRGIYKIAVGKHMLETNPAASTLGVKVPKHLSGRDKRLPFTDDDLQRVFGSDVYTKHLRSKGQAREASYWIPLIMFYTGARPEEIAGLQIDDLVQDNVLGWYLNVTDIPSPDDADLFAVYAREESEQGRVAVSGQSSPVAPRRLKNNASRRRLPVAQQLIELGLLRYAQTLREQGHVALFPTLREDTHGKLSGATGKFWGRYIRTVGVSSPRKTLYSLRHTLKDLLVQARVPSKHMKRLLGHTSGDGAVTDGYGSDLPLEQLFEAVRQVRFPRIPALPWQPGVGYVRLKV